MTTLDLWFGRGNVTVPIPEPSEQLIGVTFTPAHSKGALEETDEPVEAEANKRFMVTNEGNKVTKVGSNTNQRNLLGAMLFPTSVVKIMSRDGVANWNNVPDKQQFCQRDTGHLETGEAWRNTPAR